MVCKCVSNGYHEEFILQIYFTSYYLYRNGCVLLMSVVRGVSLYVYTAKPLNWCCCCSTELLFACQGTDGEQRVHGGPFCTILEHFLNLSVQESVFIGSAFSKSSVAHHVEWRLFSSCLNANDVRPTTSYRSLQSNIFGRQLKYILISKKVVLCSTWWLK